MQQHLQGTIWIYYFPKVNIHNDYSAYIRMFYGVMHMLIKGPIFLFSMVNFVTMVLASRALLYSVIGRIQSCVVAARSLVYVVCHATKLYVHWPNGTSGDSFHIWRCRWDENVLNHFGRIQKYWYISIIHRHKDGTKYFPNNYSLSLFKVNSITNRGLSTMSIIGHVIDIGTATSAPKMHLIRVYNINTT